MNSPSRPKVLNKLISLTFSIADAIPYISWEYFYFAWQLTPKIRKTKEGAAQLIQLHKDANAMLKTWEEENVIPLRSHVLLTEACGDKEDIILPSLATHLPMLRQQTHIIGKESTNYLCLSDFIGKEDYIGLFGCTMIRDLDEYNDDPYERMLSQTLADRLTEAATERMHEIVRKKYWGYGATENLSIADILVEKFIGIRPAIGYPSISDTSMNARIGKLINFNSLGIKLTENGAMLPHASVSGLIIANPNSHYFSIGRIGEDQLADYAKRCGKTVKEIRPFLAANLI